MLHFMDFYIFRIVYFPKIAKKHTPPNLEGVLHPFLALLAYDMIIRLSLICIPYSTAFVKKAAEQLAQAPLDPL
ncbi:hypothetical protein SAMN05216191_114181 [Paenibacillus jilunlii]|uniref:Uncharacterized protein n=1 Tax=Paenibacillus jilunlii TaxID=682956 RepID=A0A1G9UIR0_9BACL|nr:hypothetical protein SAMN05216191_114181 [Paenibacillus jilunlii]